LAIDIKKPKEINGIVGSTVVPEPDWVAQCYQNRSTNITDDNLDNCLVTADFGTVKECYKCQEGYTYDAK